ncbi:hypothetical protein P7L53_15840 [Thermoleptolyngbya sichuanensis XZ-Cy5]|nr:hypothetical protein [Thermoleptolyngbya sichuanensis XZ-Cy5]
MNLYDAIQILRLHNQYFRCPAHIPDDARPPLVDAWALAEAIDVVLSELHAASYASTQAQLQVDQLQADLMESDEIREKLGHLLTRTAEALKGEPPEGTWHSWHDLPQMAALAIRLADDAAESVICTEGHNTEGRQWVLYPEQIAADPYLEDCIAHLEWRGLADVDRESDGVRLTFRG